MASINFNIRMDENLKEQAFPVIESYGLTPAQAVKLFLKHIADTHTIPLSFQHHGNKTPNALTESAMLEILHNRQNPSLKQYESLDEMMRDIAADNT